MAQLDASPAAHGAGSERSAQPASEARGAMAWRNLAALGVVTVGVALVAYFLLRPGRSATGLAVGQPAPAFTLPSTGGGRVSLAELRGHPLVLNFWFTNCPPCRTEMPDLQRAYTQMRAQGVIIVGIDAVGEDAATIQAFVRPLGISYPLLTDPNSVVTTRYGVNSTPHSFIVDRQGIIRATHVGQLSAADLRSSLTGL